MTNKNQPEKTVEGWRKILQDELENTKVYCPQCQFPHNFSSRSVDGIVDGISRLFAEKERELIAEIGKLKNPYTGHERMIGGCMDCAAEKTFNEVKKKFITKLKQKHE